MGMKKKGIVLKIFSTIFILLIVGIIGGVVFINKNFPMKYAKEVIEIGTECEVEPALIMAIIKTESNFREDAVSHRGATGMMQIMPTTAKWFMKKKKMKYSEEQLLQYRENITIGVKYFKFLKDKFDGDEIKALAAYNAGPERVKDNSWQDIKETSNYVKKVTVYRAVYEKLIQIWSYEK